MIVTGSSCLGTGVIEVIFPLRIKCLEAAMKRFGGRGFWETQISVSAWNYCEHPMLEGQRLRQSTVNDGKREENRGKKGGLEAMYQKDIRRGARCAN